MERELSGEKVSKGKEASLGLHGVRPVGFRVPSCQATAAQVRNPGLRGGVSSQGQTAAAASDPPSSYLPRSSGSRL